MDVTVKRQRNVQTLETFIPIPTPVKAYVNVPEHLDLEGCVLAPENSEEDQELLRLNKAIQMRDNLALGSPASVSSGRMSQSRGRRYRNETEDQRRARLARDAERRRQSRKMESDEDAVSRRAKQAAARRYYLQYLETEEDAKRRRRQNAEHKRLRRMMMSADEREQIKRKESARRAEKRKEAQELKRLQGEERLHRGNNEQRETESKERLHANLQQGQQQQQQPPQLPMNLMPPQIQQPQPPPVVEMKLSQMGFPGLVAPFQIPDPSRGPYNGYPGY